MDDSRSLVPQAIELMLDAEVSVAGESALQMAAEVWLPARPELASVVLFCLPGGGMHRGFFALQPAGDDSYHFAKAMVARGQVVVLVDHLGVGQSDRPADGFSLTPDVLAQAHAHVQAIILQRLHNGALHNALPPLPQLRSIGVGHSMGAMLTIIQQAQYRSHHGVILLGFSTQGLVRFLSPAAQAVASDMAQVRQQLVALAQEQFKTAYANVRSARGQTDLYGGAKAESAGIQAIKSAVSGMLPVPAMLSMFPGNVASEAAQIAVPVFLGVGEVDMVGPPHVIPASFTQSADVSLLVLPETGHSHFLFPARMQLFDRISAWFRIFN